MISFPLADLFCGAGGTSTGAMEAIEALGYRAELTAVNHWPVAVATHELNHPSARHLCASLDSLNPRDLFGRGELKLLWASPECTHHSVARGGAPINDQSRATAWCVTRWAEALLPDTILVENVPEFRTWGPVNKVGRPLKKMKGRTFTAWLESLVSLGYQVDYRILVAADYGDPTTRRRLFVQAQRRRGARIVWPDPTHGEMAGEEFPMGLRPWVPAREIIDWSLQGQSIFERERPLSPKTMKRIWAGLEKFGLKPYMVAAGFGERDGQAPRTLSVDKPLPTVVAGGVKAALAEPFLICMEHKGSVRSVERPMPTITTAKGGAIAVAEPMLVTVDRPITNRSRARPVSEPFPTVTGNNRIGVAEPYLLPQNQGGALRPVSAPAPAVATDGAVALVEPFLVEYYGNGRAQSVKAPVGTVTCHDRFGLVRPVVEVSGERYLLDIRFRMLQPHELAGAQGFRPDYKFTGNKTEQVKQIGNAVPRRLARAIVAAALSQRTDVSWLCEKENAA